MDELWALQLAEAPVGIILKGHPLTLARLHPCDESSSFQVCSLLRILTAPEGTCNMDECSVKRKGSAAFLPSSHQRQLSKEAHLATEPRLHVQLTKEA